MSTVSRAGTPRTSLGHDDDDHGLPYYSVGGGKSTINSSLVPGYPDQNYRESFDFQIPRNYTESRDNGPTCVIGSFEWRLASSMSYSINFTNTVAEANLAITYPNQGNVQNSTDKAGSITVNLYFSGVRDDRSDVYSPSEARITLSNPLNHTTPRFTFANGTELGAASGAVGAGLRSLQWTLALISPILITSIMVSIV